MEASQSMLASWDQAATDQQMRFASTEAETQLQQQAVNLVETYVDQCPDRDAQVLAVESRYEMPLRDPITELALGIPLVGIVDLVLEGAAGPIVVDFKTAARNAAPLEITHQIQLSVYSHLVRAHYGCSESELQIRSLIKTKVPKLEVHSYPRRQRHHFTRLFALIREYLDALEHGVFNFRPSWTCNMCDHIGTHCKSFGT